MALVKCKECNSEVSSLARVCPKCGVRDPGVTWWHKVIGAVLLVLFSAFLVSRCAPNSDDTPAASANESSAATQAPSGGSDSGRIAGLSEQCDIEQAVFAESNVLTNNIMNKFPLDGELDYHAISEYMALSFNKEKMRISSKLDGVRTVHLADDVVIRIAHDIIFRTGLIASDLQSFANTGDVSHVQSLRDNLATIIKSHKTALTVCEKAAG